MTIDYRCNRILLLPLLAALIAVPALPVRAELSSKPTQPQAQTENKKNSPLLSSELKALMAGPPQALLEYIFSGLSHQLDQNEYRGKMSLRFEVVDSLPDHGLSRFSPQLTPEGELRLKLSMTKAGANNPIVVLEELVRLRALLARDDFWGIDDTDSTQEKTSLSMELRLENRYHQMSALAWTEHKLNQAAGSVAFDRELTQFEIKMLTDTRSSYVGFPLLKNRGDLRPAIADAARARGFEVDATMEQGRVLTQYFMKRKEQLDSELARKTELAKKEWAQKKKEHEEPSAKALRDRFEAMPEKLNDLVKKNDREGVAKLLEAFLPLKEMEPTELALWTEWIEAIRHPDFKNAVVLFRGLDKFDKPQAPSGAKGQTMKPGFFSTLLTRNQGNYTRRLRSFATSRLKPASADGATEVAPYENPPALTKAMVAHSDSPIASPFLSFSTVPDVALRFSEKGMIVARIDSRRVLGNSISAHSGEVEYLVPLIVFPDEVVEHYTTKVSYTELVPLTDRINARFGLKLDPFGEVTDSAKLQTQSQQMFGRAASWLKSGGLCRRLFK